MEKGSGDSFPSKDLIVVERTDENQDLRSRAGFGESSSDDDENPTTAESHMESGSETIVLRRMEELSAHQQSQPGAYHVGLCGSSHQVDDEHQMGACVDSASLPSDHPDAAEDLLTGVPATQPQEQDPREVHGKTETLIEAVVVDEDNRRSVTSSSPVYDAQALDIDDEMGSTRKRPWCTKNRILILCCLSLVVFAIGGVVGGVVATRGSDERSPPSASPESVLPSVSPECELEFHTLVYEDASVSNAYWGLFQDIREYSRSNNTLATDPTRPLTFLFDMADFPNRIVDECLKSRGGVVIVSNVTYACDVEELAETYVYVLQDLPICTSINCTTSQDIVTTFQPYISDFAVVVSGEACSAAIDPDTISAPWAAASGYNT